MELHEITYPYKKDIKFIKPVQGHEEGELVIEFSWRCKSCDTWNNNNFTIETHKEFVRSEHCKKCKHVTDITFPGESPGYWIQRRDVAQ